MPPSSDTLCAPSPLTGNPSPRVKSVPADKIVEIYQQQYGIDVTAYFAGLSAADLYQCPDSGLRFFHPASMAGRGDFYAELQNFDWFYKEDKWEYQAARQHLKPGDKVLDIGCGIGNFIRIAGECGAAGVGLELNERIAAQARAEGLDVRNELIEAHANAVGAVYDVVASFQVLEHVTDVREFLTAALRALKPDGLLVIGVPNNGSFVGEDEDNVLNMPPHHMGWWDANALRHLPRHLPVLLESISFEPLAEIDWYHAVKEKKYIKKKILRQIYYLTKSDFLMKKIIRINSQNIHSHTVMVTFRKCTDNSVEDAGV